MTGTDPAPRGPWIADALAGATIHYSAIVRNADHQVVSNCRHSHYTREAAEHCATTFLLPLFVKKNPPKETR